MRRSRSFRVPGLLLLLLIAPYFSCGAVIEQPEVMPTPFRQSHCGECIADACDAPISRCGADPGCARWLQCLWTCPQTPEGNADPRCEATCRAGLPASSQTTVSAVVSCRATGSGAFCEECGVGFSSDPLFHQSCVPGPAETCEHCEKARCCETRAEFQGNPASRALHMCLKGCVKDKSSPPDFACQAVCRSKHRAGILTLEKHMLCAAVGCRASCAELTRQDRCALCGQARCLDSQLAVSRSLDALDARFCVMQCENKLGTAIECLESCSLRFVKGAGLLLEHLACGITLCSAECS
jgi:hypothetical protein